MSGRRYSGKRRKKLRERVLKLVVAFPDTTDAMAAEKYYKDHGLPGRLIPLPTAVFAGCGLAWCTETKERARYEALEKRVPFAVEGIYEVLLYERK